MRFITVSAVIAAIYAALTLLLQPVAYFGAAQCRLSEGLTLLAFLMPEAIPGLAVGCLAANILGGGALPDIILGTLATLAAAACSARVKNMWVSGIFPVLFNTVLVSPVIVYCYMGGGALSVYLINAGLFALCEAASVYAVGVPLVLLVCRSGALKRALHINITVKRGRKQPNNLPSGTNALKAEERETPSSPSDGSFDSKGE